MNYILRNIDDELWHKFKTVALQERKTARDLLIELIAKKVREEK